jgi:glycosyltransferase involved in cell wall biosynthesis
MYDTTSKHCPPPPQLSIIIPVYNVEPYLKECLDSVVNQTLRDIEIICVNDGSTDGCLCILREYEERDSRIQVISQENQGLSGARNPGLRVATAELITFVDSDDYIELDTYEKTVPYMTDDVDIVCFGTRVFGEESEGRSLVDAQWYFKLRHEGKVSIDDDVILQTNVSVWSKIFRKSLIDMYGIEFPIGLKHEDDCFEGAYMVVSKHAYFIQTQFYNYILRNNSIMGCTYQRSSFNKDFLLILEPIYTFLQQQRLFGSNLKLFENLFKRYYMSAIDFSHIKYHSDVNKLATKLVRQYCLLKHYPNSKLIRCLHYEKYRPIRPGRYTLLQKIFSIKNRKGRKVMRVLFIKVSLGKRAAA